MKFYALLLVSLIPILAFSQKEYQIEGPADPDSVVMLGTDRNPASATYGLGKWWPFNYYTQGDSACLVAAGDTFCLDGAIVADRHFFSTNLSASSPVVHDVKGETVTLNDIGFFEFNAQGTTDTALYYFTEDSVFLYVKDAQFTDAWSWLMVQGSGVTMQANDETGVGSQIGISSGGIGLTYSDGANSQDVTMSSGGIQLNSYTQQYRFGSGSGDHLPPSGADSDSILTINPANNTIRLIHPDRISTIRDSSWVLLPDHDALKAYPGASNKVFVTDSLWGQSWFIKSLETHTPDSALIVDGVGESYWLRVVPDNRFNLQWWNTWPDSSWSAAMQDAIDTISARHLTYGDGTLYVPDIDTVYWLDTVGLDPYDTVTARDLFYCVELKSNVSIVADPGATFMLSDSMIVYADSTSRVNMFIGECLNDFNWTSGIVDGNADGQYRSGADDTGYYGYPDYGNAFEMYDTTAGDTTQFVIFNDILIRDHSGRGLNFRDPALKVSYSQVRFDSLHDTGAGVLPAEYILQGYQRATLHYIQADTLIGEYWKDSTLAIRQDPALYWEPAMRVERGFTDTLLAPPTTFEIRNPTEQLIGGNDFHNHTYLELQSGITQNWPKYIRFAQYDNTDEYLLGANGSQRIEYDSDNGKHRVFNDHGGASRYYSAGTGGFYINLHGSEDGGTGGFIVSDGGTSASKLFQAGVTDHDIEVFKIDGSTMWSRFDESNNAFDVFDGTINLNNSGSATDAFVNFFRDDTQIGGFRYFTSTGQSWTGGIGGGATPNYWLLRYNAGALQDIPFQISGSTGQVNWGSYPISGTPARLLAIDGSKNMVNPTWQQITDSVEVYFDDKTFANSDNTFTGNTTQTLAGNSLILDGGTLAITGGGANINTIGDGIQANMNFLRDDTQLSGNLFYNQSGQLRWYSGMGSGADGSYWLLRYTGSGSLQDIPFQVTSADGYVIIPNSGGTATTLTGRTSGEAITDVTIGTGLSLTAGTLSVTGGSSDADFFEVGGTSPPDDIADNIFKSGGTVHIGGTAVAAQTLQVTGTLRVTGSDGTATTITGRDGDGDFSNVSAGVGLTLAAGALNFDGLLISGNTGSATWSTTGSIVGGSGISTSGTGSAMTITASDPSLTNEGILGVGAGGGSSSVLLSNTAGATGVTINAGTGISIGEVTSSNGGSITITNAGDGDSDDLNEAWTIDADAGDTEVIHSQTVLFQGAGGITTNYNQTTNILSIDGSGVGGGSSGWTDDGTVVRLSTASDQVGIGTATPNTGVDLHVEDSDGADLVYATSSTGATAQMGIIEYEHGNGPEVLIEVEGRKTQSGTDNSAIYEISMLDNTATMNDILQLEYRETYARDLPRMNVNAGVRYQNWIDITADLAVGEGHFGVRVTGGTGVDITLPTITSTTMTGTVFVLYNDSANSVNYDAGSGEINGTTATQTLLPNESVIIMLAFGDTTASNARWITFD